MMKKKEGTETENLNNEIQKGKGVDIGTMFVKCAEKVGEEVVFRAERNAFFEIEYTDFTKKLFDNSMVRYIMQEDKLYVVGEESLEFAKMFDKEVRRPLSKGVISPTEKEALPMVELLIKSIVGRPNYEGEIVYFSVPGEVRDEDLNIIYHIKTIEGFLKTLGYTPKPINESLAVILSESKEENFTGIGVSLGAGMVNVCLSFLSIPVFKFSVTKAGDWIDQQVAMVVDETASRISVIKESVLDLGKESNLSKIEGALSIYYNHLIEYLIEHIKQEFTKVRKMPQFAKPVAIILSGGTSLPKGFSHRFKQILDQLKLPVPVGSVRTALEPLRSVAKGALIAASVDESVRNKPPTPTY